MYINCVYSQLNMIFFSEHVINAQNFNPYHAEIPSICYNSLSESAIKYEYAYCLHILQRSAIFSF